MRTHVPEGPGLDAVFAALAHPVRRQLMATLMAGERSITSLAEPFDMTLPALSRHVRVLEEAQVVLRERRGREHICRLDAKPIVEAADWMDRYRAFWNFQLDRLEAFIEASQQEKPCPPPNRSRSSSGATSTRRRQRSSTPGPRRKR